MPYAAITYDVVPGHDDEIAEIFANFKRVDTPVMRDESGAEVGRLLGTAVFIKDDVMVRFIHYEGDFAAVAQHMGRQPAVHELEGRLAPYLRNRPQATDAESFRAHFRKATMRCVSQLSADTLPDPT